MNIIFEWRLNTGFTILWHKTFIKNDTDPFGLCYIQICVVLRCVIKGLHFNFDCVRVESLAQAVVWQHAFIEISVRSHEFNTHGICSSSQ